MAHLAQPTALIVGASNPIGVTVADYLLKQGVCVIFHGGTNRERFRTDVEMLQKRYESNIKPLWVPIRNSRQFFGAAKPLLPVDIIICIYGPYLKARLVHTPPSSYRTLFDLNVTLLALVATYCLPHLSTTDYGRIIAFGADYETTVRGYTNMALYGSAKWALASMVQSIVLETKNPHCKGYTICPGYIADEEVVGNHKQHHWFQQDIARSIMQLLDRNTAMPSGPVGKEHFIH